MLGAAIRFGGGGVTPMSPLYCIFWHLLPSLLACQLGQLGPGILPTYGA